MGCRQSKKVVSKPAAAAATNKTKGVVSSVRSSKEPTIFPGFKHVSPETLRNAIADARAGQYRKHKLVQQKEDVLPEYTPVNDSRTNYDKVLVKDMMQDFNFTQTDAEDVLSSVRSRKDRIDSRTSGNVHNECERADDLVEPQKAALTSTSASAANAALTQESTESKELQNEFLESGIVALRASATKLVGHGTNKSMCSTDATAGIELLLESHRLLILGGFDPKSCSALLMLPEMVIVKSEGREDACRSAVRAIMAILSAVLTWERERRRNVEFLPNIDAFLVEIPNSTGHARPL
jgi:hypothetical protein